MGHTEPHYQGMPRSAVVASLRQAENFIARLNPGPAIAADMKEWKDRDPYALIAAAQDDVQMALAMRQSGSTGRFIRWRDLFEHYALADDAGNGDRALYRAMARWGAFSGTMTMEYRNSDAEKDAHLVRALAPRAMTPEGKARLAVVAQDAQTLAQSADEYHAEQGRRLMPVVALVQEIADGQKDVSQLFGAAGLNVRHMMREVLQAASGLQDRKQDLALEFPRRRYGVVLENAGRSFDAMQKAAEPIMDSIGRALAPFYARDEVGMTGVGRICRDRDDLIGVIFESSPAAALAVAAAVPGYRVVDSKGGPIAPPAPKGPAPQP